MDASPNHNRWQWTLLSGFLLLIYLTFFHLCLGAEYLTCNALGVGSWLLWTAVCFAFKDIFLNRFEYGIHLLVGVDLLLEGFSPVHEGYGFYVCASCFWAVFLIYRFYNQNKASVGTLVRAEA